MAKKQINDIIYKAENCKNRGKKVYELIYECRHHEDGVCFQTKNCKKYINKTTK